MGVFKQLKNAINEQLSQDDFFSDERDRSRQQPASGNQQSGPSPAPGINPPMPTPHTTFLNELSEMVSRMDALEEKVNSLQASYEALVKKMSQTNNTVADKATSTRRKEYEKDSFTIDLCSFERDPDGQKTKYWKSAKKVNFDLKHKDLYEELHLSSEGRVYCSNGKTVSIWSDEEEAFMILKELAEEVDYHFQQEIPEVLPESNNEIEALLEGMRDELIRNFGKRGKAYFENYVLVFDDYNIYVIETNNINEIISYISNAPIIQREWDNDPFVDNPSWTDEERYHAIKNYVNSLRKKYVD